jgi:undecaprenyl-diphosphatase
MDTILQAIVLGLIQGLTEFLPISSSGHLIVLPALLGWDDTFLESLAFSVMLHLGTLGALFVYFWRDWRRLIPAGLATLRDRSFAGDPDRRLAWLIAATTVPAVAAALLLGDAIESTFRQPGTVAVMLVLGAALLWLADRWGSKRRSLDGLGFPGAVTIGAAQALALVPGVSRSGISITAALAVGLDRPSAARFSFLMATPIIAMAGAYETLGLIRDGVAGGVDGGALVAGMATAFVSGMLAIHVLLRWVASHTLLPFVVYRLVVAAIIVIWFLAP